MSKKKDEKVIQTIIGTETVIEGKITLPTSLRVDGRIIGEIECSGDVYIGKDAYVEPKIKAKNVVIAGEVNGDIETTEKIQIESKGKLTGSATSRGIIIDDGGIFNGNSVILDTDEKGKKKKAEKVAD
ncbi:bactofilin family protein [Ornithinibacillus californiensis]|uniref:bactofilin family protein n=1 Tax=Ornithinibacillus californiensis TaxID=161536 RepID=UPI000A010378|nr:polymer-forming cytoskeletal protein [Ornithinibacillus californiensis]